MFSPTHELDDRRVGEHALKLRVSDWPYSSATLPEVARLRAALSPDTTAFTFLDYSSESPREETLSYAKLDRRARQIGALLQTWERGSARILLLYPSGLDYICAFFGCLYAGMIPIPAYPPLNPRLRTRLAAVAVDCDATVALTDVATFRELGNRSGVPAGLAGLRWYTTDNSLEGLEFGWHERPAGADDVALLQYTSGSSGTPKGVMVTHQNLLHNAYASTLQMQIGADDHVFSWLPPYHDMGLIGSILTPFCAGVPLTFMPPMAFLRRPVRWLREISSRRCTVSGAPNFAYELCMNKITNKDMEALDLSCWSLAFTGAEPIKNHTMERFAARFAPSGFDRRALYPCYGMAETTLIVTGKRRQECFKACRIDRDSFACDQRVVLADPELYHAEETQTIVSCGVPAGGMQVAVVDPVNLDPLAEREVGEIVVAGPSIAAGYWKRCGETRAAFGFQVAGREGHFLRTGDLGFIHDGELYVSGRLKDMIIIRGVNHYPQDIECTVDHCHEAIRVGCGICFATEAEGHEHLVVVQEIARRDKPRSQEIVEAVRRAIVAGHEIQPHTIVLVESGSIHKTTSGKLSRRPCRDDFLRNELAVVAQWSGRSVQESSAVAEECHPMENAVETLCA